jgi:hypothetical protein
MAFHVEPPIQKTSRFEIYVIYYDSFSNEKILPPASDHQEKFRPQATLEQLFPQLKHCLLVSNYRNRYIIDNSRWPTLITKFRKKNLDGYL